MECRATPLAKIEELTLHLIRESKRNAALEDENRRFGDRLERIERFLSGRSQ